MKKVLFAAALWLAATMPVWAQRPSGHKTNALQAGSALLFKGVKTKLTVTEQQAIYQMLDFGLSDDQQSFNDGEHEQATFTFGAHAWPTDLNKDGVEEIFVTFGNSYTSGMAGSSIVLYIKKPGESYKANLGFPATIPATLPSANQGYPDLVMGGPGLEFPIWRWNGKEYALLKTIKDNALRKIKTTSIEEISRAYQKTLK